MPRKEAIIAATLPVLPILIPLALHFVLINFVFLANWLPWTYFFSHIVLILVGLWACHDKESVIAAISVVVIIIFSILLDVIQLGLYFAITQHNLLVQKEDGIISDTAYRTWQFSAACTIFNLLLKPVSAALCCVAVYVRSGGPLPGFLKSEGGGDADSYSTIHGGEE